MKKLFFTTIVLLFLNPSVFVQAESLKNKIEKIISTKKADIGVSIYGLQDGDALNINGDKHYPMQSVFKFHIALAVLNEVDKGKLFLDQNILIKKSELLDNTWSPIREKYPNGNIKMLLSEIIKYTVAESDNNGCDILLRLIGGTEKVNNYLKQIGIEDVSIQANEEEMHKEWNVQFKNWTTPLSSTELLKIFYNQKAISKNSYQYLWKIMLETKTGKKRIKGQLPITALVAHKTGTSDTNKEGVTGAINNIGIVTLPNGQHFAISIFVVNSKENISTNEKVISDISKLTFDYFINKK